jgi:hypothetical protein
MTVYRSFCGPLVVVGVVFRPMKDSPPGAPEVPAVKNGRAVVSDERPREMFRAFPVANWLRPKRENR